MIACYVSGKGMYATQTTWDFKTTVIRILRMTGLGFDTRYRYYEPRFPDLSPDELARKICDPIEYYDHDWPKFRAQIKEHWSEDEAITRFFTERDLKFQSESQVAIFCFDEAGFGTGVNTLRFLQQGKSILGFYHPGGGTNMNFHNVLQLQLEYPELLTLISYDSATDIEQHTTLWLKDRISP